MKKAFFILCILILLGSLFVILLKSNTTSHKSIKSVAQTQSLQISPSPTAPSASNISPLAIAAMRQKTYLGSDITIEQTVPSSSTYQRYIVSYQSDGLKIYGLLTIPIGRKPKGGWPVILLNHGYIPPAQYSTENSYAVMVDPFATAGYIVFKPDYRGNGNSEGTPSQIYISPDYVTDSMNALASIKKYKDANSHRIGVLGHSMGGSITLHELVISHDIKAAEIAAGVVGSATEILNWWNQRITAHSIMGNDLDTSKIVQQMIRDHGTPTTNPQYWNALDATQFVSDITTPIQIQVGTADEEVPPTFSLSLRDTLQNAGKTVDYHEYPGANHNLSPDTAAAMAQARTFFNKYLQ